MRFIKLVFVFLQFSIILFFNGQQNYFQQQVNTTIEVELNDNDHILYAKEKIVYINNSPFTIDSIFIHLWANAYKNVDTELAKQKFEDGDLGLKYAYKSERGYIDSLDFHIDEEKVEWEFFDNLIDIALLKLNKPLKSKDSVIIETPFRVKIPSGKFSRLGHVGQSYQITQWFPKPAVFDLDGWHPMSYLDQGEFYSEFGNYDVSITVPENYILMATGDLQNKDEIEFLNKRALQTSKLITENKIPFRDSLGKKDLSFPKSSKKTKTLRFIQKNVHDFAWFADKRYHVLKGSIKLPKSEKEITSWSLFTNNEAELWKKSIEYINDATLYFSKWVGEYPYNHVTAVDGTISAGGGMEYPNITVIGSSGNSRALETVIVHEVGHNWYYGILGNNERENAWMDEGLNTYIEIRYFKEKYNSSSNIKNNSQKEKGIHLKIPLDQTSVYRIGYQFNASRNYDQKLQMGSEFFTSLNYGSMVYSKTGIGFHYLKAYLGVDLFDRAMNKYFEMWKFKHPKPEDLREVFEDVTKKNLNWFFEGFIKTNQKTDYCIKKVKKINPNEYLLSLRNQTGYKSPVPIQSVRMYRDSLKLISNKWIDGFIGDTTIIFKTESQPSHFILDKNFETTDFNFYNHFSKAQGIFKQIKPAKLKLVPVDINNNKENHIYLTPLLAWNKYDKLMPGLAFYNKGIKTKKTEWLLSPLLSFESKAINGIGEIIHYHNFNSFINRIEYGYKFKSFSSKFESTGSYDRWIRQEIFTELRIRESKMRYTPAQKIILKAININDHIISGNSISPPETIGQKSYYGQIIYYLKNKQLLKPKNLEFKYTYGFSKLISSLELTTESKINYNQNLDALEIRVFAGYNFHTTGDRYNLFIRGQDGFYDYLFDRTYLGRNINFPSPIAQQSSNSHGAFKINTSLGSSASWLISTNISLKVPKVPINLFSDFGVYPNIIYDVNNQQSTEEVKFLYNTGISFNIKIQNKPFIGIYLPIFYSKAIEKSYVPGTNKEIGSLSSLQKITFVFNLNNINPFEIKKSIRP